MPITVEVQIDTRPTVRHLRRMAKRYRKLARTFDRVADRMLTDMYPDDEPAPEDGPVVDGPRISDREDSFSCRTGCVLSSPHFRPCVDSDGREIA